MAISAFGLVRSQHENSPFWQNQHWPRPIAKGTTTSLILPTFRIGDLGAELDNLAHIFMAQNVTALHRWLISVKELKV